MWQPPLELPDLRRVGVISLDSEEKDDRLRAGKGSGWATNEGYICGVSVAYHEGGTIRAHYFPLRHPDSNNFDLAQLYQWLRDLIASGVRIVTQAGLYDWGWLRAEADIKMPPAERLEEIGALATIVDENRYSYGLDALCAWRGLPGKDAAALKEGAAAIGLPKRAKPAAHIWQMPARIVGPYAEQDAISTLALFENLNPVLDREGTRAAYRLEVDLLPMVHEMRRRGIRVDVGAAERARDHLLQKRDAIFAELSEKLGANVGMAEIGRNKWLATTFDKHGIKFPRTKKGNPSFTAGTTGWMHRHPHWLPRLIVRADKLNNAAANFLQGHILDHVVNGRVHAEIHPHRSDAGGTRSLRFSYSKPPLQLMSAHDEEIAPLIRGVFLPEEGEVWAKPDISQQEFKFIVHYAADLKLPRAQEAVDRYRDDPDTDFHVLVAEWTDIARQQAKNTNYAKAFGAGVRKFAAMIGKPESEARQIYTRYDVELPFVTALARHCEKQAKRFGHLELYDGARRHWNSWVAWADWTKGAGPCAREEAERRIKDPKHPWYGKGPLHRADTHKALNALIQGSAARHTKLWMRAVWREGIVPLLQMHDSLDCSVTSREQAELIARLGEEAVALKVPMRVDLKYGRNWGEAKHSWEELHGRAKPVESAPAPLVTPSLVSAPKIEPPIADELLASDSAAGGQAKPKSELDDEAYDFLADMFEGSAAPIYLASLANPEDKHHEGPEEHVLTRDPTRIRTFLKCDRPRRAIYFCTGTIRSGAARRSKATLADLCGLHVDVDGKDITVDLAAAERTLRLLELEPSAIVYSGHGLHGYWWFRQSIPATPENVARHERLLRRLADHLGGDLQCAESSRLMRLPGSHNSKGGKWTAVRVIARSEARYATDELEAWLDRAAAPLIARKPNGKEAASGDGQAPIDVDARLAAMRYHGGNGSGVHATQLSVSAALLNRRFPVDLVAEILLHETHRAADAAGANWDWQREEREIRGMCATWLRKNPELTAEAMAPLIITKLPIADWDSKFAAPPIAETAIPPANEGGAPKTNGPAGAQTNGGSEYEQLLAGAKAAFKHEQESEKVNAQAKGVEPVDLWGKLDPPPLPTGLLPEVIERFAVEESRLMGADAGGLALGALAVCATAVSDRTQLQVKQHSRNWAEPARIWVGLIGNPSTKKTPIIVRVTKPLKALDAQMWCTYLAAKECYDELPSEQQKSAERPRQKRLRIEDTTIEGAQEVLKDSPDGVLCIQPELSGWFGSMDKYAGHRGAAKDRGFWLQSYDGGPYAINRIKRGAGLIENLSISLLGGIQPDPMRKIAADTVDDGLLQRLIPIVLRPGRSGKDEPITQDAGGRYDELIERLHLDEPPADALRFDAGAQAIRGQLEQKHIDLMAFELVNKKLASHIGKYDGLFARLCVLWHCIEGNEKPVIAESTAQRAADFMHRFLLPHAFAFYGGLLGFSDDHERLTAVAGYILAHKLVRVTNRDVQRGDRTMRGLTRKEIEGVFEQLDALGWVTRTPGPWPAAPPHWIVNPEVHRRFVARAERETAERAKLHDLIKEMVKRD